MMDAPPSKAGRTMLILVLLSLSLGVSFQRSAAGEPIHARWATDFVNSVGVNTHFADPSSGYSANLPVLLRRLQDAHIRHLRDGAVDDDGHLSDADNAAAFRLLGRAGLRVDFIVRAGVDPAFVADFPARVAPSLESFELPNEANADAATDAWAAGLRAWAARFSALVQRSHGGRYPIVGPALTVLGLDNPYARLGDIVGFVGFGNVHDYTADRPPDTAGWGGEGLPPCQGTRYASLAFAACYARAAFANRPLMSTETGWGTDMARPGNVAEDVQAAYVVRSVLLHFAAGFARTYLYELKETGTDAFAQYGLLRADGTPKPAFLALGALLRTLDGAQRSGSAGQADIAVEAPSGEGVRDLLLRRPDGRFVLVIWTGATPPHAGGPERAVVHVGGLADAPLACSIDGPACVPAHVTPAAGAGGFAVTLQGAAPMIVDFRISPAAQGASATP